jgi:hypothetical protein
VLDETALLDSTSLEDPIIARRHDLREVVVGHDLARNVVTYPKDVCAAHRPVMLATPQVFNGKKNAAVVGF